MTRRAGVQPQAPAGEDALERLRGEYRRDFPRRLAQLGERLNRLAGEAEPAAEFSALLAEVHRLKGSSGSHGLRAASDILAEWEDRLRALAVTGTARTAPAVAEQREFLRRLGEASGG